MGKSTMVVGSVVSAGHESAFERGGFDGVGVDAGEFLQLGEWDFRFIFAVEAEGDFGGAAGRVVEQALVHMADLLDVEGRGRRDGGLPRGRRRGRARGRSWSASSR